MPPPSYCWALPTFDPSLPSVAWCSPTDYRTFPWKKPVSSLLDNPPKKACKHVRRKRVLVVGGSVGPVTVALKDDRQGRRLVDLIKVIPVFSKTYFRSPFRRALYGGISLLGGFYVAQTISLSFGALGVNDVIAAILCVLFTEYVTRFYYTRPRITFPVALLNNFKMGFTYGLFIDAFKLAS